VSIASELLVNAPPLAGLSLHRQLENLDITTYILIIYYYCRVCKPFQDYYPGKVFLLLEFKQVVSQNGLIEEQAPQLEIDFYLSIGCPPHSRSKVRIFLSFKV
jgi:hypothetical protein